MTNSLSPCYSRGYLLCKNPLLIWGFPIPFSIVVVEEKCMNRTGGLVDTKRALINNTKIKPPLHILIVNFVI